MRKLPFITTELPGIGGEIKVEPRHFIVEEMSLYEPCGEGEHVYLRCTREGWTTRGLQKRLAQIFGLKEWGVGYAGLKDKHALVTQTFSLHLPQADVQNVADVLAGELPIEVHWLKRHRNKLRTGHLHGNRFRIVLLNPIENALATARQIAAALAERGVPNYYGEQRFGFAGDNAARGLEILHGHGPRQRWKRRFLIDALRSELFNKWLAMRIEKGWFETLVLGDIARKEQSGGLFEVEEVAVELPRFRRREISFTGPMYGHKMRWASGEACSLERDILAQAGITEAQLKKAGADGTRRIGRIFIDDLDVQAHKHGLHFSFTLPPGSYATTVLREFIKKTESETGDGKPDTEN